MIYREPFDFRAGSALGDIVFLIPGDAGDGEPLGVIYAGCSGLAVAVDDVVDGPVVTSVEDSDIEKILFEEVFLRNLLYPVFAVLADNDDL